MYSTFFKRLLDFTLTALGLVAISPLLLLITMVLFFANGGKPFFYQERPGKNERIFLVMKFKTMNDKRDDKGNLLPDALVQNKLLKTKSKFVRLWQKANRKVFPKAKKVFTLTESMRKVGQYTQAENVVVVPIWTVSQFLKPIPQQENPFLKKHGLQDKFVVLYSGNIGFTHKVDGLLEVAAMTDDPKVVFLIIGEGDQKAMLVKKVRDLGLQNCLLLPWQPVEELPYSLASASLAVVSSGSGAAQLSIPSKTFNMMSVGASLLCLAPKNSELDLLVSKHKNGHCFSHEQTEEVAAYKKELVSNETNRRTLGKHSLVASAQYTSDNAKRFIV